MKNALVTRDSYTQLVSDIQIHVFKFTHFKHYSKYFSYAGIIPSWVTACI